MTDASFKIWIYVIITGFYTQRLKPANPAVDLSTFHLTHVLHDMAHADGVLEYTAHEVFNPHHRFFFGLSAIFRAEQNLRFNRCPIPRAERSYRSANHFNPFCGPAAIIVGRPACYTHTSSGTAERSKKSILGPKNMSTKINYFFKISVKCFKNLARLCLEPVLWMYF
jgi:hypothetical protein